MDDAGVDMQIAEHGLTWIVGAPFEDAIGVLHLLRTGVTVRYPNIKFIAAHRGGLLLFLIQRMDDNLTTKDEGNDDGSAH